MKARWNHDGKWYDASIAEKRPDGRYRIDWMPAQADDRDKSPADLRRIFKPNGLLCCKCLVS